MKKLTPIKIYLPKRYILAFRVIMLVGLLATSL